MEETRRQEMTIKKPGDKTVTFAISRSYGRKGRRR